MTVIHPFKRAPVNQFRGSWNNFTCAMPAMAVCPSLRLCLCLEFYRNGSTNRAPFRHGATLYYTVYVRKFGYFQKKQKYTVLPCRILSQTLDLKTSLRHIDRQRVDTARQKWTLSVINWTVIGQLMLKLHYFDLSWICCTACCTTNSRQKSKYNGV